MIEEKDIFFNTSMILSENSNHKPYADISMGVKIIEGMI